MRQAKVTLATDTIASSRAIPELGNLYEPDPVSFSFETIGWKILLIVLILGIIIAALIWIRSYIKNKYRREALARLDQLQKPEHLSEVFVILKYTAMITFGRERIGSLIGKEWLLFLDKTGKNSTFQKHSSLILQAIYTDQSPELSDFNLVKKQASHWIKSHASKL